MMSDRELGPMEPKREEHLAEIVGRALREEVPIRPEWRAGLHRGVETLPRHGGSRVRMATSGRRWSVRPSTAIAAGLACAMLGAVTAVVLTRASLDPVRDRMSGSMATAALPGESAASSVHFVLVAPYASHVSLVGDFNRWNPAAMPMRRSADGRTWILDVPLAPGRHVYSFVVDGDLAADPAAPRAGDDDFGVPSSVVVVTERST